MGSIGPPAGPAGQIFFSRIYTKYLPAHRTHVNAPIFQNRLITDLFTGRITLPFFTRVSMIKDDIPIQTRHQDFPIHHQRRGRQETSLFFQIAFEVLPPVHLACLWVGTQERIAHGRKITALMMQDARALEGLQRRHIRLPNVVTGLLPAGIGRCSARKAVAGIVGHSCGFQD
jgi:hypothetical protein